MLLPATLLPPPQALRHMHSLHVVHCDLKPQNVLLKAAPRDPRGFTAKLSDFGLAKVRQEAGANRAAPQRGRRIGGRAASKPVA